MRRRSSRQSAGRAAGETDGIHFRRLGAALPRATSSEDTSRPLRPAASLRGEADRPFDPLAFEVESDPADEATIEVDEGALPGEIAAVDDAEFGSAAFDFDARVAHLPDRPGCYLMRDRQGAIVYVGKAASLRARLRQYATGQDERFFVAHLRDLLAAIDIVVTATAKEALILENELIKRHQPRFNVKLKDDKRFLHLRLDPGQQWPRLQVVRLPARDGAVYFGPYASASAARQTLAQVNRHFGLRTCPDAVFRNRTRPCLEFQIHRCLGPCTEEVDPAEYALLVRDVSLFLAGRKGELVERLRTRMAQAAAAEEFERAARLRDHLRALEASVEAQHVALIDRPRTFDAVGLYREGARACVAVLTFREGVLVASHGHVLKDQAWPDGEVVAGFIQGAYDRGQAVPDELIVPCALPDDDTLAEWLTDLRRQRAIAAGDPAPRGVVAVGWPQRGAKARLVELAVDNARQTFDDHARTAARRQAAVEGLQRRLHLRRAPRRIECYDISNISGTDPTGSMAVALDGEVAAREFRTFKVRSLETPNDFEMMREVIGRRLDRARTSGWALPDLIVVDGGKGQLRIAAEILAEFGVADAIDVVGLAKARPQDSADDGPSAASPERIFLPGIKNAIVLPPHSSELYLVTRIRDEAHRLAVTAHRQRRTRRTLRSQLDGVPGVGAARRQRLLAAFGSVARLREASEADIAAVAGIGADLARRICAWLHPRRDAGPGNDGQTAISRP